MTVTQRCARQDEDSAENLGGRLLVFRKMEGNTLPGVVIGCTLAQGVCNIQNGTQLWLRSATRNSFLMRAVVLCFGNNALEARRAEC